jgi:hypothetical protein
MAPKPEPPANIRPTPEAVQQPGVPCNEARLVVSGDVLTLYFFQVPHDLMDVPEIAEQMEALQLGNRKDPVDVRLQPTAKLMLDRAFGRRLLDLLQRHLGQD